jgi:hypothetical protein
MTIQVYLTRADIEALKRGNVHKYECGAVQASIVCGRCTCGWKAEWEAAVAKLDRAAAAQRSLTP